MIQRQVITKSDFIIKTSVYEGPFELILELIEKRKLLVNDISLTSITNDFIIHVRAQKTFPLEETTHFIAIAATLLLIKSKSLIPQFTLSEDEEDDVAELKIRLQRYKQVKEAARELQGRFLKTPLFARNTTMKEITFSPGRDCIPTLLADTLFTLLSIRKTQKEQLPKTRVQKTASLEDTIQILSERVRVALDISFREFSGFSEKEKINVVVSFLALLELVKQGTVDATQHAHYEDIRITDIRSATPSYNIS